METKLNYSKEIVKAYNNWISKQESEDVQEWHPKYKQLQAASKRAGNKFEAICKASGLNYCNVYSDLMGKITLVSISKI